MADICITCSKQYKSQIKSTAVLKAKASLAHGNPSIIRSDSKIKAINSVTSNVSARLIGEAFKLYAKNKFTFGPRAFNVVDSDIRAKLTAKGNVKINISTQGRTNVKHVEKFFCYPSVIQKLNDTGLTEKLYPKADLIISANNSYFVDKFSNSNNLYSNIDEGVFLGNYTKSGGISRNISDDRLTYIQPSSVFTKGFFRYQCEVTPPQSDPKYSLLAIRASAPISDYASNIPPIYKLSNITLTDPSGNLIVKYKDFSIRGDSNYSVNDRNFATYFADEEINNITLLKPWENGYPFIGAASGYKLNIDFDIDCLDDPFSEGFNVGYEDTCQMDYAIPSSGDRKNDYLALDGSPLSTRSQGFTLNPNNSIRISAIEICNSGGVGVSRNTYLPIYTNVRKIGNRLTRNIFPTEFITYENSLNIYPPSSSIWYGSLVFDDDYVDNTSASGAQSLVSRLQGMDKYNNVTLLSSVPHQDSGRLTLKFGHRPPLKVVGYGEGAFSFGSSSNDFDTAELQEIYETDNFFTVDSIELKLIAKKAVGSRDYSIDVVGYSDDKILNVTPKIGSFLQNKLYDNNLTGILDNSGVVPPVSGFRNIDDLGLSSEAISSKEQYNNSLLTTVEAGDHYKLSLLPVINTTTFKEYTVPLQIYEDPVLLGKSTDYSMSSFFENLYLDLFPLPSGACISAVYLSIKYKPSNALTFHTLGQKSDVGLSRRNIKLYPSSSSGTKVISNAPNSTLINLPHSYSTNSGVVSNYTKRWRGVEGEVVWGPFNPEKFSSDFYNPAASHPFTYGYYKFTKYYFGVSDGNYLNPNKPLLYRSEPLPHYGGASGLPDLYCYGFIPNKLPISSLGFRLKNTSLFSSGTNGPTIDWTRISSYDQTLSGKITDSFDSYVKTPLAGLRSPPVNSGIFFNYKDGFAIYMRFSPSEINIGSNYNLFSSGSLFCINANDSYPLSVGYSGGKLTAIATNDSGNKVIIQDTENFNSYAYPLPLLVTYNDNDSRKLKLYTDNELQDNFNILRASSSPFNIAIYPSSIMDFTPTNLDTTFGARLGKFITEIGLSDDHRYGANIVESNPNRFYKQQTAQKFFDGLRTQNNNSKLFEFIDDDVDKWSLGEFNYGYFSADFSRLTKRSGKDYIEHSIRHEGDGYLQMSNLLPLPPYLNLSGVAYHTQVENDFLRFSLSNLPESDSFYSLYPRISKALPRGYDFQHNAIGVETIIENNTDNYFQWPNGKVGPKLIVSLYTKLKEDENRPSKRNLGLINRSIHYIKPSGYINKINSTFNYYDYIDTSETWADFDKDLVRTEFNHKYFSDDINDMFLQYDLVYPSGQPFESTIAIHAANITIKDALYNSKYINNNLYMVSSGDYIGSNALKLYQFGSNIHTSYIGLHGITNPPPSSVSTINIYCPAANVSHNTLYTYCHNYDNEYNSLELYNSGRDPRFSENNLSLFSNNDQSLPVYGSSINLFAQLDNLGDINSSVELYVLSDNPPKDRYYESSTILYVDGLKTPMTIDSSCILYIDGKRVLESENNYINMCIANYDTPSLPNGQDTMIHWNGKP